MKLLANIRSAIRDQNKQLRFIVRVNQSQSGQQPERSRLLSITDWWVQQLLSRYSAVVDFDCGVAKEESGSRIAPIPKNENACVGERAGQGQPQGSFVKCFYFLKKLLRGFESAICRAHAFLAQSINVGGCVFHFSALTPHAEPKFFFKQCVS